MTLLLVEDDPGISTALLQALSNGYRIDHVATGAEALARVKENVYDVIILDLNLPDMLGLSVCQDLRKNNVPTPILVLTGNAQVMSKITLLDAGANDYLTKPFSLGELKARIRALGRISTPTGGNSSFITKDLKLDPFAHHVEREGKRIPLRRKEFALLECLMNHAGRVVTRDTLTSFAWGNNENPWTNTVDVHIKYLRDKIDRPFKRQLIKTVHGLGYKLEE